MRCAALLLNNEQRILRFAQDDIAFKSNGFVQRRLLSRASSKDFYDDGRSPKHAPMQ